MLLTTNDLKSLSKKLDAARAGTAHNCPTPFIGTDGKPYRLERKPRGNKSRLIAALGHENVVEENGVLCVKIPLGTHGRGSLGIDPATGEVACTLCKGDQKK